ncbi:MAG: hypothetical protein JWO95_377, partial [Verrucomicrobiales bacterium]|nr:hypothetical protein [Verrucomicrobiales bacterium]
MQGYANLYKNVDAENPQAYARLSNILLMRVRFAGAAHAARARSARAGWSGGFRGDARCEDRQFFGKLLGTAFGAGCAFPFAGTHQDFTVFVALFA